MFASGSLWELVLEVPLFLLEGGTVFHPSLLPVDWRRLSPSLHSGQRGVSLSQPECNHISFLALHFVRTFWFISRGQILSSLFCLFFCVWPLEQIYSVSWGELIISLLKVASFQSCTPSDWEAAGCRHTHTWGQSLYILFLLCGTILSICIESYLDTRYHKRTWGHTATPLLLLSRN